MTTTRPTRKTTQSPYFSPKSAKSTTPGSRRKSVQTPSKKPAPRKSAASARSAKSQTSSRGRATPKAKAQLEDATGLTSSEEDSSEEEPSADEFAPSEEEEADEPIEEEDDEEEVDSDFLDDDDYGNGASKKKRKSMGGGGGGAKGKQARLSGGKSKGKGVKVEGYEDEDEEDEGVELEEGQEIAGRIYPAPKTGQVPPGRISQNTLNFLKNLQIPERNDRDWFKSHEPAFRQAEKEWQAFVGIVQVNIHEADDQVPILPPKDLIHRIYRDVRFSSDKTPYKKSFSLSTSRSGRKGLWAGYHLSISPNDRSIIACGVWQPGKNELATIRHHLLRDPKRFRRVIGEKQFVKMFGEAKPGPKGKRQNVFGHDDALKVAPKGIDKSHKDIDLLKLRSVAVVKHFTDEEVLEENFREKVGEVVAVMTPFAHMLNDFIALPPTNDDDDDDIGNDGDDAGERNGGDDDDDEEDDE